MHRYIQVVHKRPQRLQGLFHYEYIVRLITFNNFFCDFCPDLVIVLLFGWNFRFILGFNCRLGSCIVVLAEL
jgi:hypothetical protein